MSGQWTDQHHGISLAGEIMGEILPEITRAFDGEDNLVGLKGEYLFFQFSPQFVVKAIIGVSERKGITLNDAIGIDDRRLVFIIGRVDSHDHFTGHKAPFGLQIVIFFHDESFRYVNCFVDLC